MPFNHLILCHPILPSSIFPSIRVFSNESVLHIRWPKYCSLSFSISPSNGYSGLISFRMYCLDLLAVQGTLKTLLQHHSSKTSVLRHSAFFTVQLSYLYMTTGKTIILTRWTFVGKVMSLLFNMLSRWVIAFLPRSKRLLISWLQSPSAVILEPPKIKSVTVSTVSPSICCEVMGTDGFTLKISNTYPLKLSFLSYILIIMFILIYISVSMYINRSRGIIKKVPVQNSASVQSKISVDQMFYLITLCLCMCAQSCRTLCNPVDCSPPGFSVHGIPQTKTLEWVAISSSRGSSRLRDQTPVSWAPCFAVGFFTTEPLGSLTWALKSGNLRPDYLVIFHNEAL